jgi:hypothetical protein
VAKNDPVAVYSSDRSRALPIAAVAALITAPASGTDVCAAA